MTMNLVCPDCKTRLRVADELAGAQAKCPGCGRRIDVPATPPAASRPAAEPIDAATASDGQWAPKQTVDFRPTRRRRKLLWAVLLLIPVLLTGALVALPLFWPKDPRDLVLQQYLDAVRDGDRKTAERLGVLDESQVPIVRAIGRGNFDQAEETTLSGSFKEIAEFNRMIAERYRPEGEVFLKRDMTGMLAGAINLEQKIRAEQQQAKAQPKKYRDELDEAVAYAENFAKNFEALRNLTIGGPEHKSLAVTYEQLLKEWGGFLTPDQRLLLENVGKNRARWQRLLGRDFQSIGEDGRFTFEESSFDTALWLANQSSGEPPKRVRVTLARFQVGLIDSGWKVWEIRRID